MVDVFALDGGQLRRGGILVGHVTALAQGILMAGRLQYESDPTGRTDVERLDEQTNGPAPIEYLACGWGQDASGGATLSTLDWPAAALAYFTR